MTDVTDIDTGTRPFRISLFKDLSGQTVEQREIEIWDLCNEALINTADRKDDLPLFSLTVFGDQRSNKSCLRHDANALGISGVVGDYDGEQMSPTEALERLRKARISALVYTSPSHREDRPRWRVVAPTARDLNINQHAKLAARINGVLGGVLAPESFNVSQSYFIGKLNGNPAHFAQYTTGDFVDVRDDLDAIAIYKKPSKTKLDNLSLTDVVGVQAEKPITSLADARLQNLSDDAWYMVERDEPPADRPNLKGGRAHCRVISELVKLGFNNAQIKTVYRLGKIADGPAYKSTRGFNGYVERVIAFCRATEARPETEANAKAEQQLPFINIAKWQDQPVPERPWTVKDRIPAGNVTLLSGKGGTGKTILSMQLSVAHVLAKDWLGSLPDPGPVMGVYCEDDEDEIWRRLDLILKHYGACYTDVAPHLHILPLVAADETLMAVPDKTGLIRMTRLFDRICEAALDFKPKLIVLDNAADVYAGNENDRTQVRQFIGYLRKRLAIPTGAAVLLTQHPSLTGMKSGSGLSGSTAWENSVRSRIYFKPFSNKDDDEEEDTQSETDLRVLEVMKLNYGKQGETIKLKWQNGLYLPFSGPSSFEKAASEQDADYVFLSLLDNYSLQGTNVSPTRFAKSYAPTVFAKEKKAKAARLSKHDLESAMDRLFQSGKIDKEPYGPPCRNTFKLVRK
jgi:RecA-family ATPase